ncbi:MAG: hypothetical protein LUG49_08265 [Oscillospiraceae bacterium]|nr:hypothetical protein [Oscillospiraceae bacterium]
MLKRLLAVVLSLCLLVSTMVGMTLTVSADTWDGSIATSFAGGSGTEDDPYQIATGAQLAYLATLINGSSNSTYCSCYYVLTADIDLNNISWTPIGNAAPRYFKGTFDGDGHTIINLYMFSTSLYGGLFGRVNQATIKNVTLSGCNITGFTYSGGIVGYSSSYTIIESCTVSGSVSCVQTSSTSPCIAGGIVGNGNYTSLIGCVNNATVTASGIGKLYAGGLAGSLSNGTISSCCNNGSVTVSYDDAKSEYVGGLVGDLSSKSTVSDSYNTGSVTADLSGVLSDAYAGGLFGQVGTSCTVTKCYNAGVVTATAASTVYAGGLAGVSNATGATISNSYNAGTVSGTSESAYIGGLVGYNYMKNTIQNCHNVGTVSGTTSNDVGGIAGKNGGTITNAYYLSTSASTGVGNSVGSGSPVSKTAEEFASGEVTYLLNGSVSGGTSWYQTLGADSYPIFDSTHLLVYVATTCIGTVSSYNNTGDETTHSNLVHYAAVDATCTTDGSEEYWYCSGCDKYYSDADATTEITNTSTLTTAATGHTYGEPVFTWAEDYTSASAVFDCENCDDRQTVVAEVGSEATEAKCESEGVIEYTATAVFNSVSYTDTQSVAISATGHTAGVETIENVVAATCTEDGSYDTVTRCTVCNAIISSVTTVVPATGHSYVYQGFAWSGDLKSATASFKCSVCGEIETVTATTDGTSSATITTKNILGVVTRTATVTFNGETYTDTYTSGTSLLVIGALTQTEAEEVDSEEVDSEEVEIDEPIEDTNTESESDEETLPEENPTTGISLVLLPMAIAVATAVASKQKLA